MGDTSQGPSRKEFHTTAGYDVEVDPAGNVFVGGFFRGGPREFDLGMSTVVQTIYADNTQVFVLKMTQGLGAISGRVFTDTDGDGTPGTGEPWVAGATVYLDQNKNGVHDPSEVTVTSGDFGEYAFTHVSAGTYTVRQVVPTGLVPSAPLTEPTRSPSRPINSSATATSGLTARLSATCHLS